MATTMGYRALAVFSIVAGCDGGGSVQPDRPDAAASIDGQPADGTPLSCGDGILTAPEQCDGSALGGATCGSRGFDFGVLGCTASCTFDEAGCGNLAWVTVPPAATTVPVTFTMGSPPTELCRFSVSEDAHAVTLTRRFEMARYEVTQAEFQAAMGYNPSNFGGCPTCPVENLTWFEAVAYANALSTTAGLAPCFTCSGAGPSVTCAIAPAYEGKQIYACPGYRLPTGAEWELAIRAGTTTAFFSGPITSCETNAHLDAVAWYHDPTGKPRPVGGKQPNPWGLHDMAGNVFEWCHDWWTTSVAPETDPAGPATGTSRVLRGGAYGTAADYLRSARRYGFEPNKRQLNFGVRPVRTLP
jgi:formylglycine-generating enzyme required for sulfatase activity